MRTFWVSFHLAVVLSTQPPPTVTNLGSTVPPNGDVNPYGVAIATQTIGKLKKDDVLVSNFNGITPCQQGTGTTIVKFTGTTQTVFATIPPATCAGGVGLTTALVILNGGWVVVGSLPTSTTTGLISGAGCLIMLDANGHIVQTFTGNHINGPWDMTSSQSGHQAFLFVSNVLNGNVLTAGSDDTAGNVIRIVLNTAHNPPSLVSSTVIANGFSEKLDPGALIIGPTGVALQGSRLYVCDTLGNRIVSVSDAFTRTIPTSGTVVTQGGLLSGPLGLVFSGHFNLVAANGGDGLLVFIQNGKQYNSFDTGLGAGALFGLAATLNGNAMYFVDDSTNTLKLLRA